MCSVRRFCTIGLGFVVLILLNVVSFDVVRSAGGAEFYPVGFLPDGSYLSSKAQAISDDGSTVVGTSASSNGLEAYRWTVANGIVGLGDLAGGGFRSVAYGVSADGSVIVGQGQPKDTPDDVFSDSEAFRWTEADGMQSLGNIPGGGYGSRANAVSDDGTVIVGIADANNDHDGQAFRWTEADGMVGMGSLRPTAGMISSAWGISGDGETVVGETAVEVGRQAFHWTDPPGMTALDRFPGEGTWDRATAVSRDGSVIVGVGNFGSGAGNDEAFRWTMSDGHEGLGDLSGGHFRSDALAVSADGSVIVGVSATTATAPFIDAAFIWTEDAGMRNLLDVAQVDFGLNLAGWTLSGATGISADGRTIVGNGINPDGDREAWVLIISVPEPSAACLILSASLARLVFFRSPR